MATRATRLVVISDLHLGGEPPRMMSFPGRLAAFLDGLPSRLASDEELQLVIAGDFVDFLAIPPFSSWTADPAEAAAKLRRTMDEPPYDVVFDALARHLAAGHDLTVMIGNHDLELVLPQVQDAFLHRVAAAARPVRFVDDGRALRVGGALIEHGNRYDGANANDWDGLRRIASALSRFEAPPVELRVSPGSRLVQRVIDPIKERYPFVELIKPQGELTALLLFSFEPSLLRHVHGLVSMLWAGHLHEHLPKDHRHQLDQHDPELQLVFGPAYEALRSPKEGMGPREWLTLLFEPQADGLAAILDRGEAIPPEQLERIRLVLRRLLLDDRSTRPDGPTHQYGEVAARVIGGSKGAVQTVVMGHTHQARHIGPPDCARYINTGTWVDVVRIPAGVLDDGADEALAGFLLQLHRDEARSYAPTWADLRIEGDGNVSRARLVEGC